MLRRDSWKQFTAVVLSFMLAIAISAPLPAKDKDPEKDPEYDGNLVAHGMKPGLSPPSRKSFSFSCDLVRSGKTRRLPIIHYRLFK